jgi:hypothetical protein
MLTLICKDQSSVNIGVLSLSLLKPNGPTEESSDLNKLKTWIFKRSTSIQILSEIEEMASKWTKIEFEERSWIKSIFKKMRARQVGQSSTDYDGLNT